MITYQQLQSAVGMNRQELAKNPELAKALNITPDQLTSPYYTDADIQRYKDVGFQQYSGEVGRSYGSTLDDYIRKMRDPSAGVVTPTGEYFSGSAAKAILPKLIQGELDQAINMYKKSGVDPSTIPWLTDKYEQAGITPPFTLAPQTQILGDITGPTGTNKTGVTSAPTIEYLRQKGTQEVFAISNGQAYYVDEKYALANNVFAQVKEIDQRVDQKYPIAGRVSDISTSGDTTPPGANPSVPGASRDYSKPPNGSTIPPDIWNQLSEMDRALMYYQDDERLRQIAAGQANISINQDTLNKALGRATEEMTKKYGESAKMAAASLANNLALINAEFGQNYNATLQQQTQDQKKLAENYASMGSAVSGFREKARGQLATEQQGVIASSKRQLQQQFNTLGSQYESAYGSAALPSILNSNTGLAYTPVGGITGSQEYNKQSDILSRQSAIYNLERSPLA